MLLVLYLLHGLQLFDIEEKQVQGKRNATNLVEREILQKRSPGWVRVEDPQHFLTCIREEFLCITGICDRLAFLRIARATCQYTSILPVGERIALQLDVPEVDIGDIPNEYPPHFENTFPFVRGPHCAASGVIDLSVTFSICSTTKISRPYRSQHLCHSTEVTTEHDIRAHTISIEVLMTYLALTLKNR